MNPTQTVKPTHAAQTSPRSSAVTYTCVDVAHHGGRAANPPRGQSAQMRLRVCLVMCMEVMKTRTEESADINYLRASTPSKRLRPGAEFAAATFVTALLAYI